MNHGTLKKLTAGLGILFLIWILAGLYFVFDARSARPAGDILTLEVRQGATLSEIADSLLQRGVIGSKLRFKLAAALSQRSRSIFPGVYQLEHNLSNQEVLDRMTNARARELAITIPEGLRSDEIIHILVQKLELDSLKLTGLLTDPDLLELAGPDFTHLEGTLFPETYRFLENSTERTVLRRMVREFRSRIKPEWEARALELGRNWVELITLASLVEKETALPAERPLVASVYYNRLREEMHLNCDPTLIYMLIQMGQWDGDLRREHKVIRNHYNTYWYRGLPPGPIANPGAASIEAVLYPDSTD